MGVVVKIAGTGEKKRRNDITPYENIIMCIGRNFLKNGTMPNGRNNSIGPILDKINGSDRLTHWAVSHTLLTAMTGESNCLLVRNAAGKDTAKRMMRGVITQISLCFIKDIPVVTKAARIKISI